MAPYRLTSHTHVCVTANHAVFLDLKNDKYTAVDRIDVRVLSQLVKGWPARSRAAIDHQRTDPSIAEQLLAQRLLTTSNDGKDAMPVELQIATESILQATQEMQPAIRPLDLRNFVSAWMAATKMLWLWPMDRIVEHVGARKASAQTQILQLDKPDVQQLVAIYFRLQPHFFSAHDACLRNSLTMIEFLSHYGVHPLWVFGVRMEPFAAHSWVQDGGGRALNDQPDHLHTFTPILVI